ncbi:MAG: CHAT domain-containing protein [Bacteroidales bacterium]|nr:CHAT domain-containing protein [Bacteroidales bacterium]
MNNNNKLGDALANKIFQSVIKSCVLMLNSNETKEVIRSKKISSLLYNFLISKFDYLLSKNKHLQVLQDGILGYLPFETLNNKKGNYLVESIDVSYLHSFSVQKHILNRNYSSKENNVWAMAVTSFSGNPDALKTKFAINLSDLKTDIYKAIDEKSNLSNFYKQLGYSTFGNLNEGEKEARSITSLFLNSKYLTNSECTEQNIKLLSETGDLKKYKYLHFSTHGIAVPEIPELSALVLFNNFAEGAADNFLTMNEIANLKIEASLVTLSACESGLGKVFKGEGVFGISHAFIAAGANSTAVSLWQVDESATYEFMTQLYTLLQTGKYSTSQAINMVKRNFYQEKWV